MSRSLLIVAALVVVPSLATAGTSKAWNAAKKVHVDAPIIAGMDMASAKASDSFKKFFPILVAKKPKVQEVLDQLEKQCSFDPFVAINSAVAVIDNAGGDNKGAFFVALNGWDAAKLGACAQKVAANDKKTVTIGKVVKGIQEIELVSPAGESKKAFLGWIGKDVIVLATEPTDRAFVEKMMGGKGAGDASKLARKLDTSATVWMAAKREQELDTGLTMKAMYGTVKIAKGTVTVDGRIVAGDKDQATKLVDMANQELPKMMAGLPPAAQPLAKSLKVKAAGAEVQATASSPEKDMIELLSMLMLMI